MRKYACSQRPFKITRGGEKPRRYRPLARWNSEAPWTTVLSRSKSRCGWILMDQWNLVLVACSHLIPGGSRRAGARRRIGVVTGS